MKNTREGDELQPVMNSQLTYDSNIPSRATINDGLLLSTYLELRFRRGKPAIGNFHSFILRLCFLTTTSAISSGRSSQPHVSTTGFCAQTLPQLTGPEQHRL